MEKDNQLDILGTNDEQTNLFRVISGFYSETESLRACLEWFLALRCCKSRLLSPSQTDSAATIQQRLAPEAVFSEQMLMSLLQAIRSWGKNNLGTPYASTPKIVSYEQTSIHGREREETPASWCYFLAIYPRVEAPLSRIKLYPASPDNLSLPSVPNVFTYSRRFNDLLVFRTHLEYELTVEVLNNEGSFQEMSTLRAICGDPKRPVEKAPSAPPLRFAAHFQFFIRHLGITLILTH